MPAMSPRRCSRSSRRNSGHPDGSGTVPDTSVAVKGVPSTSVDSTHDGPSHAELYATNTTYSGPVHLLAWIVVGLIAGLIARWVVRDDRSGCLYTIGVGVLGALIGGALMRASGLRRGTEFRLSLVTATVGAILLLLVLQALGGRSRKRQKR
jgi:uncharacterized membrane protein YeaQ/YmgE (transglycosylase-associated protein family)